jgi:hypothetical protein
MVAVTAILSIFLTADAQPTFRFPVLYEPPKAATVQPFEEDNRVCSSDSSALPLDQEEWI